ncbi:MAG TPA: hypothetical protein VJH96_04465 [Patescibacteria group bacterium]|nr:hypothetical protein [Patescibacteria group bacterium]
MIITLTVPQEAKLAISHGQHISFGDTLWEYTRYKDIMVDIARILKIPPHTIFHYLAKVIGAQIKKGEIIAAKKGMISSKRIHAPGDAILKEINHKTGTITLTPLTFDNNVSTSSTTTAAAPFTAKLIEVGENSIKVAFDGGYGFDVEPPTYDWGGEIVYIDTDTHQHMNEQDINRKIICLKEITPYLAAKCETLGCSGFVCFSGGKMATLPCANIVNEEDFDRLISAKKKYIMVSKIDKKGVIYD